MPLACNVCHKSFIDDSWVKTDRYFTFYHANCFPYLTDLADFTGTFKEAKEELFFPALMARKSNAIRAYRQY